MMSRQRFVRVAVVALVGLASAGCIRFTVEKRVTNVPSGGGVAAASVYYFCNNDQGQQEGSFSINGGDFVQVFVARPSPTSCVFSEPDRAGATSVNIECVNPPDDVQCNFQQFNKALVVVAPGSQDSVLALQLRITNDYTPTG